MPLSRPACLPAHLACLPACLPAHLACLPACLPVCLVSPAARPSDAFHLPWPQAWGMCTVPAHNPPPPPPPPGSRAGYWYVAMTTACTNTTCQCREGGRSKRSNMLAGCAPFLLEGEGNRGLSTFVQEGVHGVCACVCGVGMWGSQTCVRGVGYNARMSGYPTLSADLQANLFCYCYCCYCRSAVHRL